MLMRSVRHVVCGKDLMCFRLLFLLNAMSNIFVSKLYYEGSVLGKRHLRKHSYFIFLIELIAILISSINSAFL